MKILLSTPPNLVDKFHQITGLSTDEFFVASDPVDHKLGSGGGTTWLLRQYAEHCTQTKKDTNERKLLLHAGGQSRRLPAYGPSGKILTPIPHIGNQRGQLFYQDLLSLQLPLYKQIMQAAPTSLTTMIVSGDVLIRTQKELQHIPQADVVCYGLKLSAEKASHHGVFVSDKNASQELLYMLQKPSVDEYAKVAATHQCLVDIGIWLLSDRAVKLLMERSCGLNGVEFYDLYTDFGGALGKNPRIKDKELNSLTVAVLPLEGGKFYHFGTSTDVFHSMKALQTEYQCDENALQTIFIQHADVDQPNLHQHQNIWIENSNVGSDWTLSNNHMITGVPTNNWKLTLNDGQCVDIVPIGAERMAVRPYGIFDSFRGKWNAAETQYLSRPAKEWLAERQLNDTHLGENIDIQSARLFPVVSNITDAGLVMRFMLNEPDLQEGKKLWLTSQRLSADELSALANLPRLFQQRRAFMSEQLQKSATDYANSGFYNYDLHHMADLFVQNSVSMPDPLPADAPTMQRISAAMFRSELSARKGIPSNIESEKAFALLREGLCSDALHNRQSPRWNKQTNQPVLKQNPVRIDIAGGWTDTPPFSLLQGGRVVNFSLSLDDNLPIKAHVAPLSEPIIRLKSIDLQAEQQIETFEQLSAYKQVGSPFSIPKAALALAGFLPRFSEDSYPSLYDQLLSFGCGIQITMQSDVPAGSGLGTSSILAATVLEALNEFCTLKWSKQEIGRRTLVLEQLLTTGGGWQDQYGGLFPGVKLLETTPDFAQTPVIKTLNPAIFTADDYAPLHLLYFTGIQRTAKKILSEIVHRMFLNEHQQQQLLYAMKQHAADITQTIQQADYTQTALLVRKTWQQNQLLDNGTNPPAIKNLTACIDDLSYGYKLPGAGGGGFLYIMAKDTNAAQRIQTLLLDHAINKKARLYKIKLI